VDDLTRERVREALTGGAWELELMSDTRSRDLGAVMRDLLAAIDDPARWCGVVGGVEAEIGLFAPAHVDLPYRLDRKPTGRLVVTPHKEGA
jgi:hypothetical protein